MKESISYTFVLNIVILFIFVCTAIVMGIFSYYRAFKANSIITNAIEKYEGYNCLSKDEIARKLNSISYSTPFNVDCRNKGVPCEYDSNNSSYAVVSYNLDFVSSHYAYDNSEKMNSTYSCRPIKTDKNNWINSCKTNKHYQYGVYTYMYVDLPVINSLLRIPFFAKTSIMYEYRNFYQTDNTKGALGREVGFSSTDKKLNNMFEYEYDESEKALYVTDKYLKNDIVRTEYVEQDGKYVLAETNQIFSANSIIKDFTAEVYSSNSIGNNLEVLSYPLQHIDFNERNYKLRAMINYLKDLNDNKILDSSVVPKIGSGIPRMECGYVMDYKL